MPRPQVPLQSLNRVCAERFCISSTFPAMLLGPGEGVSVGRGLWPTYTWGGLATCVTSWDPEPLFAKGKRGGAHFLVDVDPET